MGYPKYSSHKTVEAAKISSVELGADGSLTVGLEGGYDNVLFTHQERQGKPSPEAGWYLIRYVDGYVSFSPAKAFEDGYTEIYDPAQADANADRDPLQVTSGDSEGAGDWTRSGDGTEYPKY